MCIARFPLADLCRQIADLEFSLEQELCDANQQQKEYALSLLKRRGDTRAEQVLLAYVGPKPEPQEEPARPIQLKRFGGKLEIPDAAMKREDRWHGVVGVSRGAEE